MMGQQAGAHDQLFYSFNLDSHVPSDHLLRRIDRFLDLSDLRRHLASFYSHTGRPSIDPELMIRMLVIGYCFGIRSERRLCEEVHLNLAYRWFCRLGLDDAVPEHSTFSKNRHGRFRASGAFRWLFDEVVRRCMGAGLVKGEGFAVDASVVAADANRQRGVPSSEAIDWKDPALSTRAVHEYLEALDGESLAQALPNRIFQRASAFGISDRQDATQGGSKRRREAVVWADPGSRRSTTGRAAISRAYQDRLAIRHGQESCSPKVIPIVTPMWLHVFSK